MLILLIVVTSINAQISDVVQKSDHYVYVYDENAQILCNKRVPQEYKLVGFGKDFYVLQENKKYLHTYDERGNHIHTLYLSDGYNFKSAGGNSIQILNFNKYIYTYDKKFKETGRRRID